ncbi:hypothetical protein PENANT_c001G02167 [Penicillium antarcticum]|uniref:Granulins domain-containing protein n=1 Tax=Penicillium antarcticum TaxID=416450 RepID=A0A1V6QME2_9EURO|nr:uncharacterized protein N7508_010788 [Penicillium antarcticum]KAJ5295967.1 hypothetical protein N7508_010788 [Penicillium antarcticum]OQD90428.1 hypothetical protein PENANT_c001G02167 [Penicillium antarcticum]
MKSLILPTLLLLSSLSTAANLQDEPQLFSNVSVDLASERTLSTRDLGLGSDFNILNARAGDCRIGYSECPNDTDYCCQTGKTCCSGTSYCASPGAVCCADYGTCREGWKCCTGTGCAPIGGECCSGGYYCPAGKHCRIWKGENVCCPSTGCIGEFDTGSDEDIVGGAEATETATETATITSVYTAPTITATALDYEYYYTTIYWTYWFYFWTSISPYTVRTVTSTSTTTTTVWSVYMTDSDEATSSLRSKSSSYSFSVPYWATSLSSSSEPVTISTADPTPSATSGPSGDDTGGNSASDITSTFGDSAPLVSVSTTGVMAAVLAAAIGGLAFGL